MFVSEFFYQFLIFKNAINIFRFWLNSEAGIMFFSPLTRSKYYFMLNKCYINLITFSPFNYFVFENFLTNLTYF